MFAKKSILLINDIFIFYLSLIITLLIRYPLNQFFFFFKDHLKVFSLIIPLWLIIFYLFDAYQLKNLKNLKTIFKKNLNITFINFILTIIIFYFFSQYTNLTPKTNLIIFTFIFLILNTFSRNLLKNIFKIKATTITLVGQSKLIEEIRLYILTYPQTGYQIVSLEENPEIIILENNYQPENKSQKIINQHLFQGKPVLDLFQFYENIFEKIPSEALNEIWFIKSISFQKRPFYNFLKRIFDIVFALILFILTLPLFLIITFLIKITSQGPVIYKQTRIGLNNLPFTIYKFRTMYQHIKGPLYTEKNDKRLTPLGKFLRRTHLDEIPQLINILKGDISFIGPRPERKELVEIYQEIPYYYLRHFIKPGLTGWAQIKYKPSTKKEEAQEKLSYDLYYLKNQSFFLDLLIITKSLKYLFIESENNQDS